MDVTTLEDLATRIRACRVCADALPMESRPVFQVSPTARLLVASQAPGARVQASGIPFSDQSGERLREWMGVSAADFYDASKIAILPMGFCYPGRRRGGDVPPRRECAELWRGDVLAGMPMVWFSLLVGTYAQLDALGPGKMIDRVRDFSRYLPHCFPLPHPSWRSRIWSLNNPWFETEVLPAVKEEVRRVLTS